MQIAIDGPVAAGKGTVAYLLAKKLGILYIETGAMYRAVALLAVRNNIAFEDENKIVKLLKKTKIELKMPKYVYINGIDVSSEIRTPQISQGSSKVAVLPGVRKYLVTIQKKIAKDKNVVMEGRDITTRVIPNADLKIYLTASQEERAKRRKKQLEEQNIFKSYDEVLKETIERDNQDSTRKTDPLTITKDSWVLDTTNLKINQVVDKILKTESMIEGGKKLGMILDSLLDFAQEGVALIDINRLAEKLILEEGGTPSFKTVENYKYSTCLCLNDIVVHGIPTSYTLKNGDILGIDIGFYYKGYHTDTSWTKSIGKASAETENFLETGKYALSKAILKAIPGNKIWDISNAIEETLKEQGYSPVRQLVGHGVGKVLHEPPQVPCFAKGTREHSPQIVEGQTLAIEIIYNMGNFPVVYKNDDGWSIKTEDDSLSGLFEHTILVKGKKALVLTKNKEFDRIQV